MAKKEEIKVDTGENKTEIIENKTEVPQDKICGIIMPISAIDGCSREHWKEVKEIVSEAICASGYKPKLVSDADDSGIIQQRIIQNIYNNDIVVCDVSGKNPNVMFELGMRLAFDKPTIIIIDDKTDYSFDTSPIEHLSYPRDLKYYAILDFKEELKTKIVATVDKAKNDPNYTTFLKNFGEFEVAHVEKKEGTLNDVVLSLLNEITYRISRLENTNNKIGNSNFSTMDIEKIIKLLRIGIDDFCSENSITSQMIKEEPTLWSNRMFSYISNNSELRHLCGTPEIFMDFLRIVISQL